MKKRRLLAMVFAIVMTILVITGCENGESVTTNPGTSSTTTTTQKPEAKPTEAIVAEPTEATTPTEVTEEPTPEPNGDPVIEGVWFDVYLMNADYEDVMGQCNFPEPRLVFFDKKWKPFEECDYAILKSGETYHVTNEDGFNARLYAPKKMDYATITNPDGSEYKFYDKEANPEETGTLDGYLHYQTGFYYESGTITRDIYIKYEDGSEDSMTITITDQ